MNCDLMSWEHFSEDVCHHVLSWAICDLHVPIGYGLTNKVEMNINMFGVCVVVVIGSEVNGGLVVAIEGSGCGWWSKEWLDKSSKPDTFFCGVGGCHIFSLSGGQSDQLLLAQGPGNSSSIDEKCEAGYRMTMLLR